MNDNDMLPSEFTRRRAAATQRMSKPRLFALSVLLGVVIAVATGWFFPLRAAMGGRAANGPKAITVVPKPPAGREIATLAGGCFWSEEAIFRQLRGVESVIPGYAGGTVANPSYEQVCSESTGHAETVEITFDPKIISYHELLTVFLTTIDPTTLNRQGGDEGTSYRSAIFYQNAAQKATATQVIAEITKKHIFSDPIVTAVEPFSSFYPAEAYHRNYYALHPDEPYCQAVIAPKLAHFQSLYHGLTKG